jgi:hypothetical protein
MDFQDVERGHTGGAGHAYFSAKMRQAKCGTEHIEVVRYRGASAVRPLASRLIAPRLQALAKATQGLGKWGWIDSGGGYSIFFSRPD